MIVEVDPMLTFYVISEFFKLEVEELVVKSFRDICLTEKFLRLFVDFIARRSIREWRVSPMCISRWWIL